MSSRFFLESISRDHSLTGPYTPLLFNASKDLPHMPTGVLIDQQ